jgi:hypothetical protein
MVERETNDSEALSDRECNLNLHSTPPGCIRPSRHPEQANSHNTDVAPRKIVSPVQLVRSSKRRKTAEKYNCEFDTPFPCVSARPKASRPDMLCRKGAMALAKRLERYWHDRGYPSARFWAEPIETRFRKVGTYELYRVVCNLVKGLPPRYRDDRS